LNAVQNTFTLPPRRAAYSSRWLICMDLQREYVVPGRPHYAAANAEIAAACGRVLSLAREGGWRIVHSQLHPANDGQRSMFGAPIEGLRPLITEPVFFRRGLSAFANPAFALALREARDADVFLMGFSLADTCLATALAAIDEGLSLTLIEDALGGGAVSAEEVAHAILKPFVSLGSSRRLESAEAVF
jgi:nicotinamidase-related amidase